VGKGENVMNENQLETRLDAGRVIPALLDATMFAADKHRGQKRKDAIKTPYINHPIMVVNLMANVGGITDLEALQAGMLHDTVEDTPATDEEIEAHFGRTVRNLVMEVTDDKSLPKEERKRLQVEHAAQLSPRAKIIKLADKIANLQDLVASPPAGWNTERRLQYVNWSDRVAAGCIGYNSDLETLYRQAASLAASAIS
jgi:guanosine-3',5'-bis(diphosphate) 3'-pyrophosphohydrolase